MDCKPSLQSTQQKAQDGHISSKNPPSCLPPHPSEPLGYIHSWHYHASPTTRQEKGCLGGGSAKGWRQCSCFLVSLSGVTLQGLVDEGPGRCSWMRLQRAKFFDWELLGGGIIITIIITWCNLRIVSPYPQLKGPQKFVDYESISPTQGATQLVEPSPNPHHTLSNPHHTLTQPSPNRRLGREKSV